MAFALRATLLRQTRVPISTQTLTQFRRYGSKLFASYRSSFLSGYHQILDMAWEHNADKTRRFIISAVHVGHDGASMNFIPRVKDAMNQGKTHDCIVSFVHVGHDGTTIHFIPRGVRDAMNQAGLDPIPSVVVPPARRYGWKLYRSFVGGDQQTLDKVWEWNADDDCYVSFVHAGHDGTTIRFIPQVTDAMNQAGLGPIPNVVVDDHLNRNAVVDRVLAVVKDFPKVDPSKVTADVHFQKDLGLDSLDNVVIVRAIA